MFKFLFGCVIGLFFGFVVLAFILISDFKFDIPIITNIVIAGATVVATIIHYSSIRQQRKDRIWEINKPIILDLSQSLSSVIRASEFYYQLECARTLGDIEPNPSDEPDPNVYKEFSDKREYALTVFKGLMNDELLDALKDAKYQNEKVDRLVEEYNIHIASAYQESIGVNRELQEKLNFFIVKLSGVKEM